MQQQVKDSLINRNIEVMYPDKTTVKGVISGRFSKFAHITWQLQGINMGIEVAWETIINCLNNGKPVRM